MSTRHKFGIFFLLFFLLLMGDAQVLLPGRKPYPSTESGGRGLWKDSSHFAERICELRHDDDQLQTNRTWHRSDFDRFLTALKTTAKVNCFILERGNRRYVQDQLDALPELCQKSDKTEAKDRSTISKSSGTPLKKITLSLNCTMWIGITFTKPIAPGLRRRPPMMSFLSFYRKS